MVGKKELANKREVKIENPFKKLKKMRKEIKFSQEEIEEMIEKSKRNWS